ncbi:polycystic kidney disease protein 1-like 2 [Myripristis murdjan]|uniref:polycystic kidney disease protein 1-like 2 n=1 Tax=Myripristis murdjan TaxID=586833 RepID=UPI001175FE99|nr:polycystic kidney disease protein 1-like 2 [Myripristis murdjan]
MAEESISFIDIKEGTRCCDSTTQCKYVFRNVCYEFVEGSESWFEARGACEKRGGELLKLMSRPVKSFLENITVGTNTANLTWWLAEEALGEHEEPNMGFARSADDMALYVQNIDKLLEDNFIKYLLEGTKQLTSEYASENNEVINHIINCSSGILLLSMKRCDVKTNPNPTSLFEQVLEIYQAVSVLLGTTLNTQYVIQHPGGTIYHSTHKPAGMSNAVLGSEKDGMFIKFPSYSALESQLGQYKTISAQMATLSNNPHPSDDNISGTVCSVFLSDGHSDIKLSNLTEMIEIFLLRPGASAVVNTTVVLKENTKALSTFNISDPNVTVIFGAEPSSIVSLQLLLYPGSRSNKTYYSSSTILNHTEGYRWIVTPEMREQTTGVWYIETILFNSSWEPGLTLHLTSFTSKCMFWDTQRESWSTDGCWVGEKTTPYRSQCLCNHLTLFGSSFFVMPNYVDLSRTTELFSTVSENYVVLALLCAFFGLYLITLLWACFADRRSRSRRKMTVLEDNHPCAQYNYLLSVQTGSRKNSGTSANVTVRLIGSEGESELHNLTDPDKPVFERGAVDMFLLATPFPLGKLQNLRLQHDNSGGHPSWYWKQSMLL